MGGGLTWRAVGASVEGASHVARGVGCQDAHGVLTAPDGSLVVVVADGAGSASRAAEGSALAVEAALDTLEWVLAVEPPSVAVVRAVGAARVALETADDISAVATTLLVVVVGSDEVAVARVGDGFAVARLEDGSLELLSADDDREFLNETTFLSSSDWTPSVSVRSSAGVSGVAVLTDGLQLLAFDLTAGRPHAPFFEPLFAFAADCDAASEHELAAFLGSDRVAARTDDDVTLVLCSRSSPTG